MKYRILHPTPVPPPPPLSAEVTLDPVEIGMITALLGKTKVGTCTKLFSMFDRLLEESNSPEYSASSEHCGPLAIELRRM